MNKQLTKYQEIKKTLTSHGLLKNKVVLSKKNKNFFNLSILDKDVNLDNLRTILSQYDDNHTYFFIHNMYS